MAPNIFESLLNHKCRYHKVCHYVDTKPDSYCMTEGGGPYCGEWRFLEAHQHKEALTQ